MLLDYILKSPFIFIFANLIYQSPVPLGWVVFLDILIPTASIAQEQEAWVIQCDFDREKCLCFSLG